jgi:hypothetical protein
MAKNKNYNIGRDGSQFRARFITSTSTDIHEARSGVFLIQLQCKFRILY